VGTREHDTEINKVDKGTAPFVSHTVSNRRKIDADTQTNSSPFSPFSFY
jgi:hypothetical protein